MIRKISLICLRQCYRGPLSFIYVFCLPKMNMVSYRNPACQKEFRLGAYRTENDCKHNGSSSGGCRGRETVGEHVWHQLYWARIRVIHPTWWNTLMRKSRQRIIKMLALHSGETTSKLSGCQHPLRKYVNG